MLPHMLPHKLLNLLLVWKDSDTSCRTCCSTCPSAASCVHRRPRLYLDVTWNPTATGYQSENGIPNDVIFSAAAIGLQPSGSSDVIRNSIFWLVERNCVKNASQLVAQLVWQHDMWPVWKHYYWADAKYSVNQIKSNHLISETNRRNKNNSKTGNEIMLWGQKGYYNDNCPEMRQKPCS